MFDEFFKISGGVTLEKQLQSNIEALNFDKRKFNKIGPLSDFQQCLIAICHFVKNPSAYFVELLHDTMKVN